MGLLLFLLAASQPHVGEWPLWLAWFFYLFAHECKEN